MLASLGNVSGIMSHVGASQSALSAKKLQPQPPEGPAMLSVPEDARANRDHQRFGAVGRPAASAISAVRGESASANRTVSMRHTGCERRLTVRLTDPASVMSNMQPRGN